MDKKVSALLGAVATLATLNAAQAASTAVDPREALKATSFGDLLTPIPNAAALLRSIDAMGGAENYVQEPAKVDTGVQVAQYYYHHHHHHHHRYAPYYRYRRYHHHHHHHHHHRYWRGY
jgi:hypothetical protein